MLSLSPIFLSGIVLKSTPHENFSAGDKLWYKVNAEIKCGSGAFDCQNIRRKLLLFPPLEGISFFGLLDDG